VFTMGSTVEKSEMREFMLRSGGPGLLASMMRRSFSLISPVVVSIPLTFTTKPSARRSGMGGSEGSSFAEVFVFHQVSRFHGSCEFFNY